MVGLEKYSNLSELLRRNILNGQIRDIDNFIQTVIDFRFEHMKKSEFIYFMDLISLYIDRQIKEEIYRIDGIAYIFRKLNKLRNQLIVKEFLESNYINILEIFKQLKYSINIDLSNQIVEVLSLLFMLEGIDEICLDYIDFIIENDLMENRFNLSDMNKFNYIYILAYYGRDDEFLSKYSLNELIESDPSEELDLYREYKKTLKLDSENLEELEIIINNLENITINVYAFIKEKIIYATKVNIEGYKSSCKEIEEVNNEDIEIKFSKDELMIAHKLIELDQTVKFCMHDKAELIKINARIPCYSDIYFKNIQIYEIQELLYCEKCNKFYILKSDLKYIKYKYKVNYEKNIYIKLLSVSDLDIKSNSNIKHKKSKDKNEKQNISIKNNINNKVDNNGFSNALNEKSFIKKLGYSTKLSKKDRWEILKNSAVPKLGINKVCSHIEFLIRLNKNKGKNFSNALSIWREDLEMLKRLK